MSILEIYYEQLNRYRNKKIIISNTDSFTFEEVENYSNYIALNLKQMDGCSKVVPFYLKKQFFVLPVVIGILKAGLIPLPLNTSLDIFKSLDKISDVDFDIVIVDISFVEKQNDFHYFKLQDKDKIISEKYERNDIEIKLDNFYILCTSGTTGIPKKVFIKESNIIWILKTFYKMVNFNCDSRFLFTTPHTFDVSLTEIFAPVFTGGTLVCMDSNLNGLKNLPDIILDSKITHLSGSPSYVELVLDVGGTSSFDLLEVLCVAGEVFPSKLANKLRNCIKNGCRVFNLYGPTETSIYATYYELSDKNYNVVPIGKPLEGVKIKLIPEDDNILNKGELCIGGNGLTAGYLLQPDLKKEKFKYIDGEEYYFTGDYVHYYDDNNIIFDGRRDDQVQINGVRVELDEISSVVSLIQGIISVKVTYDSKRIYIFYKANIELKDEILNHLPKYIKPIIIKVDKYILNQNRKLDFKKMIYTYYTKNHQVNNSKLENTIDEILYEYNVETISDMDSLDTIRFFLDIEDKFGIRISNDNLYKLKTVDDLVKYIQNSKLNYDETLIENTVSGKNSKELDFIEFEYKLSGYNRYHVDKFIDPTCTQQRLFLNKQFNLVWFDLALKKLDYIEIVYIESIIKQLAEKIDILRMIAKKSEIKLNFAFIDIREFVPFIILLDDFIETQKFPEIIEKFNNIPTFIVTVSKNKLNARFYFLYHSMDAYSLNIFEKIMYESYTNKEYIESVKSSSFLNFKKFLEKTNQDVDYYKLLRFIPKTSKKLDLKNDHRSINIAKFNCNFTQNKDIILFSIYTISKCILEDYDIDNVTGGISYNFREYKEFDAKCVLGDVHTKIPFEVSKLDNYEIFKNRFNNLLEVYSTGIDLRYLAYKNIDNKLRFKMLEKWNELNLSINYIGEVLNVSEVINALENIDFESNFMNIFTNRNNIYAVIKGAVFSKKKYFININGKKNNIDIIQFNQKSSL
ncbi:MAG: AMP-binding protein [Peptoniphilaceae bacterium]|uniref:non-ribosomal peptide synthetase n=1 Tax=Parvimonas sp. TaxID=1944660 RepID=UPI0025E731A7|nr:AMP-binding protein [Parvimonas sp.]MCI5996670.1 AMP-binding protein [Parvimonas sp.]MDD7764947.1 AMP-binding protein [Peptoniphilaceae bacterium]MDY3050369.1 AMP-binding protein [Parvimonas sp.]